MLHSDASKVMNERTGGAGTRGKDKTLASWTGNSSVE